MMRIATVLLFIFALRAFAQSAPEDFTKAVYFGKKFFELKEYASAYEQFAKADALLPDQPAVLYDMAVLLAKSGKFSEAQRNVDRYVRLFPNGAEKALIAKLQLELDFQRELQKKRQGDQSYVELFNRGKFLYTRDDLLGALKAFQSAELQRPGDAALIFNEAVVHEHLGDLVKANERFHRYLELETDADLKSATEQRIFALEADIEDMKTKIVCPFCGFKLPKGAPWCPHCWHGPYFNSAVWNTRPCADGASATRATYFADNRFSRNDSLPCLFASGTVSDSLRYTPSRQRAIQETRKAEGWTYSGDVIQGWSDQEGQQVRYVQGSDVLEKIVASDTGEVLLFSAHSTAAGIWLLDREDMIIEGQKYTIRRKFDSADRIAHEEASYQNGNACNHLLTESADYGYQNGVLVQVKLAGGYDGFPAEGSPRVDWQGTVAYAYDQSARVAKENLAITSWNKVYKQKPFGALRDEVSRLYSTMRPNRPIENVTRVGDLCATVGNTLIGNRIDLRPFYAMSPNLAIQLPFGVTRAVVSYTYP
ncbi:MAG: tetratricopeptide repeat protein [Thermoanaerobaculia bacterium]